MRTGIKTPNYPSGQCPSALPLHCEGLDCSKPPVGLAHAAFEAHNPVRSMQRLIENVLARAGFRQAC